MKEADLLNSAATRNTPGTATEIATATNRVAILLNQPQILYRDAAREVKNLLT
jgi:hypothetical protein